MPESGAPDREKTTGRTPPAAAERWPPPEPSASPPALPLRQTPARNNNRHEPLGIDDYRTRERAEAAQLQRPTRLQPFDPENRRENKRERRHAAQNQQKTSSHKSSQAVLSLAEGCSMSVTKNGHRDREDTSTFPPTLPSVDATRKCRINCDETLSPLVV